MPISRAEAATAADPPLPAEPPDRRPQTTARRRAAPPPYIRPDLFDAAEIDVPRDRAGRPDANGELEPEVPGERVDTAAGGVR